MLISLLCDFLHMVRWIIPEIFCIGQLTDPIWGTCNLCRWSSVTTLVYWRIQTKRTYFPEGLLNLGRAQCQSWLTVSWACQAEASQMAFSQLVPLCNTFFVYQLLQVSFLVQLTTQSLPSPQVLLNQIFKKSPGSFLQLVSYLIEPANFNLLP